jgi:hypothetical protein
MLGSIHRPTDSSLPRIALRHGCVSVLFVDRQALITALFSAGIGAIGCRFLARRDWWRAAGWLALGAAALLNMITEGPHSPGEDLVKVAVTVGLMAIFVVTAVVHLAHARSVRDTATRRL